MAQRLDLESAQQRLMTSHNGVEAYRLVERLLKSGPEGSAAVLAILMDYARNGPLDQLRGDVVNDIAKRAPVGDEDSREFFEEQLLQRPAQDTAAYWSVDGLIRVAGSESYQLLTALALDPSNATELRAKAIKALALHGGQSFIQGLPPDVSRWKVEQLPLDQLRQWAEAGYPAGPGPTAPLRHADLDSPITELDRAASRLDRKLAKKRKDGRNWLSPASENDLATVQARWRLPAIYVEFLRKFSPIRVTILGRRFHSGLRLLGAPELPEGQNGYSFNPVTQFPIGDWPEHYVVIASDGGDPYVLDLTASPVEDAPVLTARHGEGRWSFEEEAPSFLTFLKAVAK